MKQKTFKGFVVKKVCPKGKKVCTCSRKKKIEFLKKKRLCKKKGCATKG